MKPLTYGSLFSGTECMSAAARQVLDFLVLKAVFEYNSPSFPVYVKEFMKWRGSKNKSASEKRLKDGLCEIFNTSFSYRGDKSVKVPLSRSMFSLDQIGNFYPLGCLRGWEHEDDDNPRTQITFNSLFFSHLLYAAITKRY